MCNNGEFKYAVVASFEDDGIAVNEFKSFEEAEEDAKEFLTEEGIKEVTILDQIGDEVLRVYKN